MTLLERLGGMARLRTIIEDFYARVFDDVMIGFMFKGRDRARLVELEVQFTARAMGENVAYEGRGMRHAHASLPILIGHFQRRYQILVETLDASISGAGNIKYAGRPQITQNISGLGSIEALGND